MEVDMGGFKVLLVDDELTELEGLRLLVPWSDFGLELVWSTDSPTHALQILREEPVDVLVSDIRMPGMSGIDVFSHGKEFRPDLIALFISGHADFSYAKRAIEESAAAYILKPVDDMELATALKAVVARLERLGPRKNEQASPQPNAQERLIVRDVKRAIDESMDGTGTSLKELAWHFGVTPNHLGFVFHLTTGEFFTDYLTQRRLERAKILLKDPQLKIYEVANRLGYKNISHFNRIFREKVGMTPREYRDNRPAAKTSGEAIPDIIP